jgi:hypothetical protein
MPDGLAVRLGKVLYFLQVPSSIRIPATVREIGDSVFTSQQSPRDLSFEEGIVTIGVSAFSNCPNLYKVTFPASLIFIEANAFSSCNHLHQISFAVGSQLQYTRSKAFLFFPLNEVAVPASIVEIDPSAFSPEVWQGCVKYMKTSPSFCPTTNSFVRSMRV